MIKPGTVVNYKPVDSDGKRNSSSYQGLVIGSIFGSPKKNVVVLNIAGQHSYDLLNEDNQ